MGLNMLNKEKLSTVVFDHMRIHGVAPTKFCAEEIVAEICRAIQNALAKGMEVNIPEIGKFFVQYYQGGKARNPATNQVIDVVGRNKVKFKTSTQLRKLIN